MLLIANIFICSAVHAATFSTQWAVKDARLRGRVLHAMKEYLYFTQHDTLAAADLSRQPRGLDLIVTALENTDNDTRQLTALQYDTLQFYTTETVRAILGEPLYNFLAERKGYDYDVNAATPEQKLGGDLWLPPQQIVLSFDRQMVRISPSIAFVNEFGDPNIQMPWWGYGMFRAGVQQTYFKFLFQGPFAPGLKRIWFVDPRTLDGAFGGAFEFHVEHWSGELAYATMSKQSSLYLAYVRPPFVNYVSFIGQVAYSLDEPLGGLGAVEMTFGAGMHVVKHDSIAAPPEALALDAMPSATTIISPLVRIAYISTNDDVESAAQYYNTSLMFSVAAHVAGSVWLAGSAVLIKALRTPQSFEPSSFLFLTPMLRW